MAMNSMNKNRTLISYLVLAIKGFCMGASDVVPGVSGGTMAFILGIYEELVKAIRSFDLKFLKLVFSFKIREAVDHVSWQFLMAIGLGIFAAIFSLAKILSWMLQNQPVLIWSFFFGLIVSSVFTVGRHLNKWAWSDVGWMLLGAVGTYFLVGMVPVSTPDVPWFLFMSGAIAICAMILPGISGAFILVLLGKYHYVLDAVNNRDLFILLLVAAGAGFGLVCFSRFLSWLFKRHHDLTIAILTGLMLGSLRKVWPWKKTLQTITDSHGNVLPVLQANILPPLWNKEVTVAIGLMVLGFLVVFCLNLWAKKKNGS
jgi:putative membrane protein